MTITERTRGEDGAILFVLGPPTHDRCRLEDFQEADRARALWFLSVDELREEIERLDTECRRLVRLSKYEKAKPLGAIVDEIEVFLHDHPNHK